MLQLGPDVFALLNAKQWVGNRQPVVYGKGGLSILDIRLIEAKLGFRVPDDFAFLLQNVLDPGEVLFPWSNFKKQRYEDMIEWVREGILSSVANGLWLRRWGERPKAPPDALEKVRNDFATWPKLLPICGHRFLAAEPWRAGNPVFSIMGTDIVYYGANLAHYLVHEFVEQGPDKSMHHAHDQQIQSIEIWSDFAEDRPDLLAAKESCKVTASEIAAALRANLRKQVRRPLIELELKADGNVLLDGELFDSSPVLEAKLRHLTQHTPPPDLRVRQPDDFVSADVLEQCQKLLERIGYSTILLLEVDGTEVTPVFGTVWRLN
ncbi:MAG TPA: hypothetical protein VK479_09030 [Micropepsaceae bacterium]|jgi:hypothetical protein|nr:hypothetical protein [Micropepsaceae bacterium]